jgi:hypothetical protein
LPDDWRDVRAISEDGMLDDIVVDDNEGTSPTEKSTG